MTLLYLYKKGEHVGLEQQKAHLRAKEAAGLGGAVAQAKAGGEIDYYFINLDQHLRMAELTLEDLGITAQEVERYRHAYWVQSARNELVGRDELRVWGIQHVIRLLKQRQITFGEIGISAVELHRMLREEALSAATECLQKCRSGVFEYSYKPDELWLNGLLYELENFRLTPEDIGTSWEEIESFKRPDAIALCRHLMNEIQEEKQRGMSYWSWQLPAWTIFRFMKLYELTAADLEVSEDELSAVAGETAREFVKSWAQFVAYGDGRLSELDKVVRFTGRESTTLTDEELEVLRRAEQILLRQGEILEIE